MPALDLAIGLKRKMRHFGIFQRGAKREIREIAATLASIAVPMFRNNRSSPAKPTIISKFLRSSPT